MERLKKWWILMGEEGVGPVRLKNQVEAMGSLDRTWHHAQRSMGSFSSLIKNRMEAMDLTLADSKTWALSWEDLDYPSRWRELSDAPVVIFGQGSRKAHRERPFLGIVGTRDCSQSAAELSFEIAQFAAIQGWGVVSGLAKGVDAMAHRGACYGEGITIACLGGPLHRIYPREHRGLAHEILGRGGTLITERAHNDEVHPWHFASRNRLIVGMSQALVMVQSPARGGALISAQLALESGVDCWVYRPDSRRINDKRWAGNLKLLEEFPSMGWSSVEELFVHLRRPLRPSITPSVERGMEPELLPIWKCIIQKGGAQTSEIAQYCGSDAASVMRKLFILELNGMVQRIPGGWYIPRHLG